MGLACLARHGVLHRDIKPGNLLVDDEHTLKLADFGLARLAIPVHLDSNPKSNESNPIPVGHADNHGPAENVLAKVDPYKSTLSRTVMTLWWRAPEVILGMPHYGFAVDIWSAGCIFGHMLLACRGYSHHKRALFCGDSEIHQLFLIFQQLGTPDETIWPGVSTLKHYNCLFPQWKRKPFEDRLFHDQPERSNLALDLLSRMLTLNPYERITAKEALLHPFFTFTDTAKHVDAAEQNDRVDQKGGVDQKSGVDQKDVVDAAAKQDDRVDQKEVCGCTV